MCLQLILLAQQTLRIYRNFFIEIEIEPTDASNETLYLLCSNTPIKLNQRNSKAILSGMRIVVILLLVSFNEWIKIKADRGTMTKCCWYKEKLKLVCCEWNWIGAYVITLSVYVNVNFRKTFHITNRLTFYEHN